LLFAGCRFADAATLKKQHTYNARSVDSGDSIEPLFRAERKWSISVSEYMAIAHVKGTALAALPSNQSFRQTMSQNIRRVVVPALAWVGASLFAAAASGETPANAFSRTTLEIAAGWHFQLDVPDIGEKENWQAINFDRSNWTKVDVRKAWDLFDEAMWGYEGVGWYATEIAGSLGAKGKVQRLKIGRVNYHAKVWLNGELLGENLNGYLPRG
jgi:hypothetical protein